MSTKRKKYPKTTIALGVGPQCRNCMAWSEKLGHTEDFKPKTGKGWYDFWYRCVVPNCKVTIFHDDVSLKTFHSAINTDVAEFNPEIYPGLSAVEKRWYEVSDMLDKILKDPDSWNELSHRQAFKLLGELDCLYILTQYMGSNSRTGWLISFREYSQDVAAMVDD